MPKLYLGADEVTPAMTIVQESTIVFDGIYDTSTNPAATVSTVKDALVEYVLTATFDELNAYVRQTVQGEIDALQSSKQNTLAFDGTYNAETNKVATVKTVADKLAEIVADAPDSFNTLKEMSDWITEHADSAAAMNSAIQTNTDNIGVLQTSFEELNKKTLYAHHIKFSGRNVLYMNTPHFTIHTESSDAFTYNTLLNWLNEQGFESADNYLDIPPLIRQSGTSGNSYLVIYCGMYVTGGAIYICGHSYFPEIGVTTVEAKLSEGGYTVSDIPMKIF